jgi:hypothetical protein
MAIKVREVDNPDLMKRCKKALTDAGYSVSAQGTHLAITQAGFADKSVDFAVRLVDLDGHLLLQLTSILADSNESFERVALAVARGNMHCHTVAFSPAENATQKGKSFSVIAQTHIYADYFSDAELASVVYLFARELDEIDNEIRSILSGE